MMIIGYFLGRVRREWKLYRKIVKSSQSQDFAHADIRMIMEKVGLTDEYVRQNRCRFMRKKSR
jgi:hypothetical protein